MGSDKHQTDALPLLIGIGMALLGRLFHGINAIPPATEISYFVKRSLTLTLLGLGLTADWHTMP